MSQVYEVVGAVTVWALALGFVGACLAGLGGWVQARASLARERSAQDRYKDICEERRTLYATIKELREENRALQRATPYRGVVLTGSEGGP